MLYSPFLSFPKTISSVTLLNGKDYDDDDFFLNINYKEYRYHYIPVCGHFQIKNYNYSVYYLFTYIIVIKYVDNYFFHIL